jgi:hypothetical protein
MAERGDSAISSVVRVLRPWCTALAGISSKRRGAHGGSHLGQRSSWEVAVVAHDGGATSTGSVDDGGWLWCSSGLNKTSGSLAMGSSCFPRPSTVVSGGGR